MKGASLSFQKSLDLAILSFKKFFLFLHYHFEPLSIFQQVCHEPRAGDVGRVLTSQQYTDQDPSNFRRCKSRSVSVFGFHENLQEILRWCEVGICFLFEGPFIDDFLENFRKELTSRHAFGSMRVGDPRKEKQDRDEGMVESHWIDGKTIISNEP